MRSPAPPLRFAFLAALLFAAAPSRSDSPPTGETASVAIAFTGTDARLDALFDALKAGVAGRGFISGVESDAGTWRAETLPRLKTPVDEARQWLDCCVTLGTQARTTFQNALETHCWLEGERIRGPIVLLTSAGHMRRAAAALRAFVADRPIDLLPVHDWPVLQGADGHLQEYGKWLAMKVVLWAPRRLAFVKALYGPWADGCPSTSPNARPEVR